MSQCMMHRLGGSVNNSGWVYTMVISSVVIGCCAGLVGALWLCWFVYETIVVWGVA